MDLETRQVVDLLPDRRAETLAAWLRPRRRRVRVVARDRSNEFVRGVELGTPRAVQVADHWHLLKNVREMLTRWLFGVHARLRRLPTVGPRCRAAVTCHPSQGKPTPHRWPLHGNLPGCWSNPWPNSTRSKGPPAPTSNRIER